MEYGVQIWKETGEGKAHVVFEKKHECVGRNASTKITPSHVFSFFTLAEAKHPSESGH